MKTNLSFDHNGIVVLAASFRYNAIELLAKYGIQFDRAAANTIPRWSFSGTVREMGDFVYFMMGDCDVAYWHSIMQTLVIHDKPRKWGKPALDNLTCS